ncbi:MAG: MarR family transcriptional regulator, partial [Anaerolineae bacterium]|jgi:DNA-binding MarR family transcriptional regulator|nr:MarR family transcriptional regulator [Anaerolineae bacterium]
MACMQDTLSFALIKLGKAHRAKAEMLLSQFDLHPGQEQILFRLFAEEGQPQAALAELLCVEPPTVTKMLQRMERRGWIERRGDPDDARLSRVYLTEAGRALQADIDRAWDELERSMTHSLTEAERALLMRLFGQMQDDLSK